MNRRLSAIPVAALLIVLAAGPVGAVCPGCIEGSSSQIGAGFFWSIMFMMAVPFFVIGSVGGGLYLAYRRLVRQEVDEFLAEHEREMQVRDSFGSGYP